MENKRRTWYADLVRRCSVSVHGTDKQLHTLNFDAASLYAAADQAIKSFCKYWWFDFELPLEVIAGDQSWRVDQEKVRRWRTKR